MGLIKFYFSNINSIQTFEELNDDFIQEPNQFYYKHGSTIDLMMGELESVQIDSIIPILKILGIDYEPVTLNGFKEICKYELAKVQGKIDGEVSLYSISTLMLHFLTHDPFLHNAFFVHPSIDLEILRQGRGYNEFTNSILQEDYLSENKVIRVYEGLDVSDQYFQLSSHQIEKIRKLIASSMNQMEAQAQAILSVMSNYSNTIILKLQND